MLTTKEIAQLIERPQSIKKDQLNELSELANKYPYTQLLSLLYLKGLKLHDDIDFEAHLLRHSYRISDRSRLYHLINTESVEIESTSNLSDDEKIIPTEIISDQPSELFTTPAVENSVQSPEENVVLPIEEDQEDTESIEVDSGITFEIPEDPLEKTILSHVVASNYTLQELTPEEEEQNNKESTIPASEESSETTISTEIESDENLKATISIDTKQSFGDWLHSNVNYTEPEVKGMEVIESLIKPPVDENEALFGEIEKPKKEFFSPTKKAKESLDESGLPVSETLAKIYAVQGNYPKAISAYEQLSLKYPEKKIFFANQIKELEKKLNT